MMRAQQRNDEGANGMLIQVKRVCGKFFSQVRNSHADGFGILFESSEYLTEGMAHADAKCWLAFHEGEKKMSKVEVDAAEIYTARQSVTGVFAEIPAERVAHKVAEAYRFGRVVEVKTGGMGQRYIEISNGKGSAYGQYHVGAEFRDKVVKPHQGKTMLTPRTVKPVTRQEHYGTPAYFGKIEWFDAVDRETSELLPFEVSRVDQYDITVNGPKGLILTGLASLRDAVEAINARR
ncbi:hypothetical protein [Streptomyces sp. NBC_01500]|uniref:hypothetical protein n=1 Tax=Streptomyces sp. NBC_01500 TaxID=2903886 RepID=UPI00225C1A63|nr:hypothetical protein [Streptomyces sp. NBC_01500]MCX4547272.1 hypothetical protein [Streptomyces sp. NBC_01500]MCX4554192.1 hypothetical protein [Streptomyces sp. NBC_01500]MCX4554532.1 hypothetical protein [Streptomyces sp. NBC_01500]